MQECIDDHCGGVPELGTSGIVILDGTNINPLTPNDHYIGRTAPLTSKRSILYIYSTKNRY